MDSTKVRLRSICILLISFRAIMVAYEEISKKSLEDAIENECSKDLRMGYKAIVRLAKNPGYYYARTIHKAMKGDQYFRGHLLK